MNGNNSPRNVNTNIGFRCCANSLFGNAWDGYVIGYGHDGGARERLGPTPRWLCQTKITGRGGG